MGASSMGDFYLTYQHGESSGIRITACVRSWLDRSELCDYLSQCETRLVTDLTPREALDLLEKDISKRTKIKPSATDGLRELSRDNSKKYSHYPRYIDFLPLGSWPRIGEPKGKSKREADSYNSSLHGKIFPVYLEFVNQYTSGQKINRR